MAVLEIVEFPNRVLKQVGVPVEKFDAGLEEFVADMFETMYADEGVGLAAPQVGLSLRLFVMDCEGLKLVAANPEIVSAEGEQEGEEGCLSVGKIHAPLKRAARVRLRAQDLSGQFYEREAEGLTARCFLHETDHCDGLLFLDRLSPLRRDMIKRRFQKVKRWR
ncbi:MAG: peptide deformylase [Acidobacteriota bacterium]|nr:peptide deformylase [Acidobacteriota bacterium]